MQRLRTYPDIEALLVDVIDQWCPGRVDSQRPADLKARIADTTDPDAFFVEIQRYGGTDNGISDRPAVEVAVYAATHAVGSDAALQLRERLVPGPHVLGDVPALQVIDSIGCLLGPSEVPYGDSGVRKWVARYRVSTRRGA